MKLGRLWAVVAFLMIGVVICVATVGLFFLSGGTVSPEQETLPEAPQNQPEGPLRVVVIDAGHGGEDGGAVGVSGLVEKDLNLDIAKRLAACLEKEGVRVVMTRSEDVLLYDRNADFEGRKKVLDLAARQAIGDAHPDGIFVSIHANTFPQQIYHGLQVWYSGNHPQSLALAESLRAEVVGTLQPENHRQCKMAGSNIYLLYHLQTPAVLVECGFLSNPAECRALEDAAYRDQLAHALCRGIMAYYENNPM